MRTGELEPLYLNGCAEESYVCLASSFPLGDIDAVVLYDICLEPLIRPRARHVPDVDAIAGSLEMAV